jgi:hypothetical protein
MPLGGFRLVFPFFLLRSFLDALLEFFFGTL